MKRLYKLEKAGVAGERWRGQGWHGKKGKLKGEGTGRVG